ncbi:hypothetical protein [Teichococcus oryzae]|uniref:Tandem-95 repeat protein n=1 Tax=Teichococcus oryzae TaxID=1608942 RepID=A0A5B2TE74_9PROT|nr:hypothetical protein [Pseudoroseomonas oryzae]KAA2212469.1 hypothetical protein F0Q34_14155 [Pseudoroseomonas oryzae]
MSGSEDTEIALALSAALAAGQQDAGLSVIILGVPAGASLSSGSRQGDGSWLVASENLAGLSITPSRDFAGTLELVLRATAQDSSGSAATEETRFSVQVVPVVDGAVLVGMAAGREDQWITLETTFGSLADDSEQWGEFVLVHGVPQHAALSQGEVLEDGNWAVRREELAAGRVAIRPPADSDATIMLRLEATIWDGAYASAGISAPLKVEVAAMADAPFALAASVIGVEDRPVALDLSAALSDVDGSESLVIRLLGLPAGASLSAGRRGDDGSWLLDGSELSGLSLLAPPDYAGTLVLTLHVLAREANGDTAVTRRDFSVLVQAVADPVTLQAAGEGQEDGWIPLRGSLALNDTDGSEHFGPTLVVRGVPMGAMLSHGLESAPGVWEVPLEAFRSGLLAVLPPADSDADFQLVFSVASHDGTDSSRTSQADVTVVVRAGADAPTVTVQDFHGREDTLLRLSGLGGALQDRDGSEALSFVLSGVPQGSNFSSGTRQPDGSWLFTSAQLASLSMAPPGHLSGSFTMTLTARATEARDDQPTASTSASFTVRLDPVLDAGTIKGNASGSEDNLVVLRPSFATPDNDGSEQWSALTRVAGLPDGASLTAGTEVSPGVWDVSTSDLRTGLISIIPPYNSDVDFKLTLTATLSDTGNGITVSREVTGTSTVTIAARADKPLIDAADAAGAEDGTIPLSLAAGLTDLDGSERLSVKILGVPAGGHLSHGTRGADGGWSVDPADLPALTLIPPKDFSGNLKLTLQATSHDNNSSTATVSRSFTVQVAAVADEALVRTFPALGREDAGIALRISALPTDIDGSETIVALRLADVPEGAIVRAGGVALARQADGSILVQPGQISGLTITPPPHSDQRFTLRVSAISAEANGSQAESAPVPLIVTVQGVADAPVLANATLSGLEDHAIPLNLGAIMPDADGSEALSFVVSGLPDGAVLSAGTYRGPGVWSLTAAEAAAAVLHPPADYAGTLVLTVTAVTQEAGSGSQARSTATLTVRLGAVVDQPGVGGMDGISGDWGRMRGTEDQPITLRLDPGLADRDGSERLVGEILIHDVPAGAVLRLADGSVVAADADGVHRIGVARMEGVFLQLPANSDAEATLRIGMMVEDTGGVRRAIGGVIVIDPAGDADIPLLVVLDATGTGRGVADLGPVAIPLHISTSLADTDGSETLHVWVRDVPQGAVLSAGVPAGGGVWRVPASALADLALLPPAGYGGSFSLRVTSQAIERDGDEATVTRTVRVTVAPPSGSGGACTDPDHPATGPVASLPAAQAPLLRISDAATDEDNAVTLAISLANADNDEGRETLGLRIEGVPAGAFLSAGGRDPLTGHWVLSPAELAGLRFLPPADFAGTIMLAVYGIATEATGDLAEARADLRIEVADVVDGAVISAAPIAAAEDRAVPLNLRVTPRDADHSETVVSIVVTASPGASINGPGVTALGGMRWAIDPEQMGGITATPPLHSNAPLHITVEAVTREAVSGDTHLATHILVLPVAARADAPLVSVADAMGMEDRPVPLQLAAALRDMDGSEILSVVLQGLPSGSRLSAGLNNGDGSWTLTGEQLAGLTLIPPADWDGDMALKLVAHAREISNGSVATTEAEFHVIIAGVADMPVLTVSDRSGMEDTRLPLNLQAALLDHDGSEQLTVTISGLPEGFTLSRGVSLSGGQWRVSGHELAGLELLPAANWNGNVTLVAEAVSREAGSGSSASVMESFRIVLSAVNDAPVLELAAAVRAEAGGTAVPALGGANAADVDSAYLSGAVVSLSGALVGDMLNIGGFELTAQGGRLMIGGTGIEVLGGGYNPGTGMLRLGGRASPGIYAAVLQSLVLENAEGELAAGTRTIAVKLTDQSGAASAQQSVALAVGPGGPDEAAGQTFTGSAASEAMTGGAGADLFLISANGGHDVIDGGSGAWTDQITVTGAGEPGLGGWTIVVETPGATMLRQTNGFAFDQAVSGHISFSDGTQADFLHVERIGWT